jgi:diadenosine tetraphosphate (Ap4A) HIT family hydrolase
MTDFKLDPRLTADCIVLGEMRLSLLLLLNNALVPWFILVPRRDAIELYELAREDQLLLLDEINLVSSHLKTNFPVDKLNVAAIGNMVRQLHIHVIGRSVSDFRWPDVVWGSKERTPYSLHEITAIREAVERALPADSFRSVPGP